MLRLFMGERIRFRMQDSFGTSLGYKADVFWSLSKEIADINYYSIEAASPQSGLFQNLLYFLNIEEQVYYDHIKELGGEFDSVGSLCVVVENESGEMLSKVDLFIGDDEKYQIAKEK